VYGVSGYTRGAAWGHVAASSVADDALTLAIDLNVGGDAWMKGGRGEYRATLKRGAAGQFEGRSCLFAVADAIAGGKPKSRKSVIQADDLPRAKVEGNAVTVTKPDGASLRMSFLSPPGARIAAEMRSTTFKRQDPGAGGLSGAPGRRRAARAPAPARGRRDSRRSRHGMRASAAAARRAVSLSGFSFSARSSRGRAPARSSRQAATSCPGSSADRTK
jgi:hypothetical protein